ncbi:serine protease [Pelomonas sp. KK5]|uniref:S1 family peptidase n=1 Tax=Pelomonas sp. KK5 TaxID=1855730 RepID=UPI00097C9CA4|nr:serine protease [Pelomonas sp. KK5]
MRRISWAAAGRLGAILLLGAQLGLSARAAPLDADIQRRVREATFEVVLPKPAKESLSYDKPWQELMPYQVRSDMYVPIGTAFSIGSGRYATAMHVLSAAFGDSRGEPMLRDAGGNVYPIGQIVKGSADQDFVVFTLAKSPGHPVALELQASPELNETVYAVGNALGEGIVVREGNYTSDTPEEEGGRWQWQRFSAPISGGNSGGPLLDGQGRVIGIVRAMRSSENTLNFAVPIRLVTAAPDQVFTVDSRVVTGFPVFDKTRTARFTTELPLPKRFADFSAAYMKAADDFNAGQLHQLLADNAGEIFPRGSGSERVLHGLYGRSAPGIVVQGSNGNWTITQPTFSRLDLGHEGWQDAANFKGVFVYHRRRPDDIDPSTWYSDPQVAREAVLKSSPAAIHINGVNAKVLSLGRPEEDTPFADAWGRTWQVRVWRVTTWFASEWQVEFDLPVPDGSVGFETRLSALGRQAQLERLKLLTSFIAVSYEGKLSQWDEFLSRNKAIVPKQIAAAALRIDYGHSFAFDGRRLAFSYGPELQKIDRDSRLRLDFGFISEADGVVLDIAGVATYDGDEKTETGVFRHAAPAQGASEDARKEWGRRLRHEHPYDAMAMTVNGRQSISTVNGTADAQPAPGVLYTFQYRAESGTPQDAMKAKLDLLTSRARVKER